MNPDPAAPELQKIWDWRAAGNFIAGGAGSGLLISLLLALIFDIPIRTLSIIGLILIALGLSMVWMEIGRTWRALNVFFHPQTSWMTREAMVAAPLVLVGIVTALTEWRLLIVLLAILAAAFLYCQAHILKAAKGIPIWRHPRIVPLIIATGLTEGVAILMIINQLIPSIANSFFGNTALILLLLLLIARYGVWRYYLKGLQGAAPLKALTVLQRTDVGFMLMGMFFPVIFSISALLGRFNPGWLAIAAGLLAVYGGWLVKFVIVTRASYNQGYAINHSPARGGGVSGAGHKPGW